MKQLQLRLQSKPSENNFQIDLDKRKSKPSEEQPPDGNIIKISVNNFDGGNSKKTKIVDLKKIKGSSDID